jgi:hypothetical protein
METQVPNMAQTMIISSYFGIIVAVIINVISGVVIYKNKKYFKNLYFLSKLFFNLFCINQSSTNKCFYLEVIYK